MKLIIIFTAIFTVILNHYSLAKVSPIESYLNKNNVVILGDTGFDLQSTAYIKNAIQEYVNSNGCINIGLEISTDQQDHIEKAFSGEEKFSKLRFNEYTDRESYLDLLLGLREMKQSGKCLNVYAIDKPDTSPVEKDAWMATQVEKIKGTVPLLVLAGNLQAIKRVEWINPENNTRFLAERLRRNQIRTASIMQYWTRGECPEGRVSKFILARGPRAASYVNDVLGSIDAKSSHLPSEVTDTIIVWKCKGDSGSIVDPTSRSDIEIPDEPEVITDSIKDTDLTLDDIALSDLRKDIKNERLRVGMSKDHVLLSKGKPTKAVKRSDLGDNVEQWIYECSDDWGFDYECIIVTFNGNQVAKVFDIE